MYIRKRGKVFQCMLRFKGARLIKSFALKSNAIRWSNKTFAELEAGTYVNRDRLFAMQLKDLLQLYMTIKKSEK